MRRAVLALAAAGGLLLTGAGACDDGGPGVGQGGEQGDDDGYGSSGEGGEGGEGDEIGGGG
jgi:hypothetical protein